MAARRRPVRFGSLIALLGVIVALGWLANVFKSLPRDQVNALVTVAIVIGAGIVLWFFLGKRFPEKKLDAAVATHLDALLKRRAQLLRQDAYGRTKTEKWEDEIGYFLREHVVPTLRMRERRTLVRQHARAVARVGEQVTKAAATRSVFEAFSDRMTPMEFEAFCAEELRRNGWIATVTQTSRDQGVDVIAVKDGRRVVLQCKLYGKPVGNKAVQEAAAGRAHERAAFGAVVSNIGYTAAAQQLAATNGILLLHYSELARLEEKLAAPPTAS